MLPSVTLRLVRPDGWAFPTVRDSKSGTEYTIATPGATYQIEYTIDAPAFRVRAATKQIHLFFRLDGVLSVTVRGTNEGRDVRACLHFICPVHARYCDVRYLIVVGWWSIHRGSW